MSQGPLLSLFNKVSYYLEVLVDSELLFYGFSMVQTRPRGMARKSQVLKITFIIINSMEVISSAYSQSSPRQATESLHPVHSSLRDLKCVSGLLCLQHRWGILDPRPH